MCTILEQLDAMQSALNVKQVSALLNINRVTLYDHARSGKIPAFAVGGSVRFDPAELAAYLRRSTRLGVPKAA